MSFEQYYSPEYFEGWSREKLEEEVEEAGKLIEYLQKIIAQKQREDPEYVPEDFDKLMAWFYGANQALEQRSRFSVKYRRYEDWLSAQPMTRERTKYFYRIRDLHHKYPKKNLSELRRLKG